MWVGFFRALGLDIIAGWLMGNHGEPKKVAIRKGYASALKGSLIHLIPVIGVTFVVALNIRGHLFGYFILESFDSSSDWQPALQYVAKLHEILMIASLRTIAFHMVSSELCCRKGLPYGATFSGFSVGRPSFLWSQEMWGLITSGEMSKRVKLKIATVIICTISLSVAVGPASANVMIPRLIVSPVGQTPFWLNSTSDNLFPAFLDDSVVPSFCANISGQPSINACPSSGWEALAGFASLSSNSGIRGPSGSNWAFPIANSTLVSSFSDSEIDLEGSYVTREMYVGTGSWPNSILITTQHAALSESLGIVDQMWAQVTQSSRKAYSAGISYRTLDASQPYAAVNCTENHTISGLNDSRSIPFLDNSSNYAEITTMNRSQLLQTQGNATAPNLLFVDLTTLKPSDNDTPSLGAVIVNSNQSFATCTIHAGWASIPMRVDYSYTSSDSDITTSGKRNVNISPSWAEFLNPITDGSGTKLFGSLTWLMNSGNILSASKDGGMNQEQNLGGQTLANSYQTTLAALVANGLANVGIDATLQGNLTESTLCIIQATACSGTGAKGYSRNVEYFIEPFEAQPNDWYEGKINNYVQGLAYSHDGVIIKVSFGLLLAYALAAVVFTIYELIVPRSSSAWRSVSTLTTLALLSPKPDRELEDLRNTCVGIHGLGVFKKNVRIVAVGREDGEEVRDELQMVFAVDMPAGCGPVEANVQYGN